MKVLSEAAMLNLEAGIPALASGRCPQGLCPGPHQPRSRD